jgi:hypothetical protein
MPGSAPSETPFSNQCTLPSFHLIQLHQFSGMILDTSILQGLLWGKKTDSYSPD